MTQPPTEQAVNVTTAGHQPRLHTGSAATPGRRTLPPRAAYALAALLLAGGVSDDVGRRPVLLAALGALMASTVLFMLADSAAWLFIARGLQGLATGAALSAASAALLDLHPRRDPAGVGLTNATAAAGGIGLGILVSSSLVQLGSAPRVLPYVVLLVLFAITFA